MGPLRARGVPAALELLGEEGQEDLQLHEDARAVAYSSNAVTQSTESEGGKIDAKRDLPTFFD